MKLTKKQGARMTDYGNFKEANISEMKNKYFIITCNKGEVEGDHIFIVDECVQGCKPTVQQVREAFIVVLCS